MSASPRPAAGSAPSGPASMPRPTTVPYIARWSAEQSLTPDVVATARGLAYPDETLHDRDQGGALWARTALRRGQGRPDFGGIHSQRQRRAMQRLLCQVCGGPADRTQDGVLWLVEDRRGDWKGWPEGLVTTHPPVCLPCARLSVAQCHHLLTGPWVALRVRDSVVEGVYGRPYHLQEGRLVRGEKAVVLYDNPGIRWVVASQLTRTLRGCTIVQLL